MSEKFKTRYTAMQNELNASESLIQHTLSVAHPAKQPRRAMRLRTAALVAAVFMLLIAIALPVMASTDTGYALLYSISPEAAQLFRPVKMSCENEGIELTIESIYIHEDTAEIYVSLQDLIGNRIDETTALCGNYMLDFDFSGMVEVNDEFLYHDPDTRTNYYLLTLRQGSGNELHSKPMTTFTLGQIVIGQYSTNTLDCGLDLSAVTTTTATARRSLLGWGGSVPTEELKEKMGTDFTLESGCDVLVPGTSLYNITQNIDITAAGYKDGMLRVQVCHSGAMGNKDSRNDDFGEGVLYLVDKEDPDNILY
ncbi:MAG: DUF4179 domain-containing protein, partial [Clostridia bacterium]|nr:DUF4179 domain-containing protein [Clostridia bacterium]